MPHHRGWTLVDDHFLTMFTYFLSVLTLIYAYLSRGSLPVSHPLLTITPSHRMDNFTWEAEKVLDQAERLSVFAGVIRPGPHDRLFLVLGKTGSGKSTFVS
ncbi:hypothetical protein BJY04DRAFT_175381 [Aspergillus karnatakaensis]|uniref:uncharacterized protein n=1 Tax=Aspergillus karnatakaensis TaxID=1810916 RepID=UPI003CCDCC18